MAGAKIAAPKRLSLAPQKALAVGVTSTKSASACGEQVFSIHLAMIIYSRAFFRDPDTLRFRSFYMPIAPTKP